jgi:hypothetical protein
VSKPITFAQGAAAASLLGLGFGFAGVLWRWLIGFASVSDFLLQLRASDDVARGSSVVLQHALPLALGIAACLVIAPLALYLALSDE